MLMVGFLTFAFSAAARAQSTPAPAGSDGGGRDRAQPEIREIEKGTYAQANVGAAMFLDKFAGAVSPGTSLGLSIGHDFVDQEKTSMAFEFAFFQGIHNGESYQAQVAAGGPFVEGDLRTYTLVGLLEWSHYPSRRVGIGLRAGGGMMTSPLLMDEVTTGTRSSPNSRTAIPATTAVARGRHGRALHRVLHEAQPLLGRARCGLVLRDRLRYRPERHRGPQVHVLSRSRPDDGVCSAMAASYLRPSRTNPALPGGGPMRG